MFLEFAPHYLSYVHSTDTALARIVGAYIVKVDSEPKKHIFVSENLNLGIESEDFIQRFDLKGSQLNRFSKGDVDRSQVKLDSDFLY